MEKSRKRVAAEQGDGNGGVSSIFVCPCTNCGNMKAVASVIYAGSS